MSRLDGAVAGKHVIICAGAGGVGKPTLSPTVALRLATQGRRVALVTIDPARRLAEALGLGSLGNRPLAVDLARFRASGLEVHGELSAMMLDAKRTFDELIGLLAPSASRRDEILANPDLRAHLDLRRRISGIHGDREAVRARAPWRSRRDRARHAAGPARD